MSYIYKKAIKVPLYRGYLVILITNSSEKVKEIIPFFDSKIPFAHALLYKHKNRDGFYIVLNPDHDISKIGIGTIAHESVHIAHFIAECRGIIPTFENDEPIAYLTEWVAEESYKFLLKSGFSL